MADKEKVEKVVRYVGTADERAFLPSEFARKGVDSKGFTATWNKANGFTVPMSDLEFLSPDDFRLFIGLDSAFVVEEAPKP